MCSTRYEVKLESQCFDSTEVSCNIKLEERCGTVKKKQCNGYGGECSYKEVEECQKNPVQECKSNPVKK